MNIVLKNGVLVDDILNWNVMCCLDECDTRCGAIHQCWLSPNSKDTQVTIKFE